MKRNCHLLDSRNHGNSGRSDSMTFTEMAQDVINYADSKGIRRFTLMGHSMGGKAAMTLATMYPNRLDGLIIIDAPPKHSKNDIGYKSLTVDLV